MIKNYWPSLFIPNKNLMKPLVYNDYEIDVLTGKIAAALILVFGFFAVWRQFSDNKISFSVISSILLVLIPVIYLISLKTYNINLAKLAFRSWTFGILLVCLLLTKKVLNNFSWFWTVILPFAFVTVCMLIGLKGIGRIKEGIQFDIDKTTKIPESYHNLRILIGSVDSIILFLSIFTIMVLAGKYFHDFVLANWQSLEEHKILLFYMGIAIGYYPSKILGAAISCVFTFLVNLIYKCCVKLLSDGN
jgi:hypothetical protein